MCKTFGEECIKLPGVKFNSSEVHEVVLPLYLDSPIFLLETVQYRGLFLHVNQLNPVC